MEHNLASHVQSSPRRHEQRRAAARPGGRQCWVEVADLFDIVENDEDILAEGGERDVRLIWVQPHLSADSFEGAPRRGLRLELAEVHRATLRVEPV